jgi:biotin carboxyl carrier protein
MIHRYSVDLAGSEREISVEKLDGNRVRVTHGGRARVYEAVRVAGSARASTWSLLPEGGGRQQLVDVDGAAPDLTVTVDNQSVPVKLTSARAKVAGRAAPPPKTGPSAILSPMPGKVVKVLVAVGDEVKSGQGVVVVEAMKMENELRASRGGTVAEILAREGMSVDAGALLLVIQ